MIKVCVVGLGYIGLPTASLLATRGFVVHGVDINEATVEMLNRGQVHICEPDLGNLVKEAVRSGNFIAALEPTMADVFMIAVPTPFKEDHVPDTSYIEAAVSSIAPYLTAGNLVILESTSPVGTTEKIEKYIQLLRPDLLVSARGSNEMSTSEQENPIYIAYCPERVLPGQILSELINNDRIIGGINKISAQKAKEFYQKFVAGSILTTDSRTAELTKLTENSFRDVNIAFANELSIICDKLRVNVWELIEFSNRHPRVNILQPGPGVGGHCIAVDPWFIVDLVPEQAQLIRMARKVNDEKPDYIVKQVKEKAFRFKEPIISCLGLSFKADVDDLRESPATHIVLKLAKENVGTIYAVEPHIQELPETLAMCTNVTLVDIETAIQASDIVVLLVNHQCFTTIDRELLKEKILIDTRGIWR